MHLRRSSLFVFVFALPTFACSGPPSDAGSTETDDASDGSQEGPASEGVAGETGTASAADSADDGTGGGEDESETGQPGDGDSEAGGSEGGDDTDGLDRVEAACEADCEAQFATTCTPPNSNELTCKYSCASATVQLDGFCYEEYADWVQCRADGGYDCVNGYPTPRSTCALQAQAYNECATHLGCKRFCNDTIEAGCETAPFDTCLTECVAEGESLPGYCEIYFESMLMCRSQLELVCGAQPPNEYTSCDASVAAVGECIYDENGDPCEALCYIADALSCDADCATECPGRLADPTCGAAYLDLVDCELFYGDLVCMDGELVGTDLCESENTNYQNCLAG